MPDELVLDKTPEVLVEASVEPVVELALEDELSHEAVTFEDHLMMSPWKTVNCPSSKILTTAPVLPVPVHPVCQTGVPIKPPVLRTNAPIDCMVPVLTFFPTVPEDQIIAPVLILETTKFPSS